MTDFNDFYQSFSGGSDMDFDYMTTPPKTATKTPQKSTPNPNLDNILSGFSKGFTQGYTGQTGEDRQMMMQMQNQMQNQMQQEPTFWDNYKWLIIGGVLVAGGIATYFIVKK